MGLVKPGSGEINKEQLDAGQDKKPKDKSSKPNSNNNCTTTHPWRCPIFFKSLINRRPTRPPASKTIPLRPKSKTNWTKRDKRPRTNCCKTEYDRCRTTLLCLNRNWTRSTKTSCGFRTNKARPKVATIKSDGVVVGKRRKRRKRKAHQMGSVCSSPTWNRI